MMLTASALGFMSSGLSHLNLAVVFKRRQNRSGADLDH
jgi:hypothetical protein